jgi:hypothetical protein
MKQTLFIGLNHDQIPYLKVFKDLGYYVIGIDKNCTAPGVELVDFFVNRGYDDYNEIEKGLLAEKHLKPNAVFTAAAQFSHVIAARLAGLYGIRYPSPALINKILDKSEFYNLFSQNGLPIPQTEYVYSSSDLKALLIRGSSQDRYFVKSDFSKNPKYVYSGAADDLLATSVNWNVDTHFRSCYVVQPEIPGASLRINIIGDDFEIYDFDSGSELNVFTHNMLNIAKELKIFCKRIGLESWIVKFDVIDTGDSFATLDIGIDPPSRMVKKYERNGLNFAKFYVEKYLNAFE